ncbi:hypothetical protein JCM10914A_02740 [Paenibacillus sp. JCM 10914]|uniref:DUF4937 domain-containing protein n=1 Tax=Paenibacillus sp. JCM 10914 TaxID=1236974 RepID=UPI0003CC76DC|nr:DUF4937 domain-containing protein [Paenibacillus sp. JCM 10914]GAE06791.1 hypothetical protein JCM10914_2968 [Paenibacillus sp. JCM 10914]
MYFKWVECRVGKAKEDAFFRTQPRWGLLSDVTGFIAQCGGWERTDTWSKAHIFGVWQDKEKYHRFMMEAHDEMFKQTQQYGTYESITIRFGELEGSLNRADRLVLDTKADKAFYELHDEGAVVSKGEIVRYGEWDHQQVDLTLEPQWFVMKKELKGTEK